MIADKLIYCDKMFYCCLGAGLEYSGPQLYEKYMREMDLRFNHKYGYTFAYIKVSTATDDMSIVNSFINICGGLLRDGLTVMEIHIDGEFSDALNESIIDFAEYWLGEYMDYIGTVDNSVIFGLKPEVFLV